MSSELAMEILQSIDTVVTEFRRPQSLGRVDGRTDGQTDEEHSTVPPFLSEQQGTKWNKTKWVYENSRIFGFDKSLTQYNMNT